MSVSTSAVHGFDYVVGTDPLVNFVVAVFPLNGRLTSISRDSYVLDNRDDKYFLNCIELNYYKREVVFSIASPDPLGQVSWFANAGEHSCLKAKFKQLMAERLRERLGGLYTEFEKKVASETLLNAGGPITIRDLRYLNTLAYDMAYLSDAMFSAEYFCILRHNAQMAEENIGNVSSYLPDSSLATTVAVQAWDSKGGQSERSPDREFKLAFGADLKSVLSSCPEKYRSRLVEHLKYTSPEIKEMIARLEGKRMSANTGSDNSLIYPGLERSAKSDFTAAASIALLYDVDLDEPAEQDNVEKERSLFARLFCCCFAPAATLN